MSEIMILDKSDVIVIGDCQSYGDEIANVTQARRTSENK